MKIVYIDMQNIHQTTKEFWWIIDREKLREYLIGKIQVNKICIFLWYVPKFQYLYKKLIQLWFELIFKEVCIRSDGTVKWNVDIDIAIHAMKDIHNWVVSHAYLFSSDTDYNSLIYERKNTWVFWKLYVPYMKKTSYILRKAAWSQIESLDNIKHIIEKKSDKQKE